MKKNGVEIITIVIVKVQSNKGPYAYLQVYMWTIMKSKIDKTPQPQDLPHKSLGQKRLSKHDKRQKED